MLTGRRPPALARGILSDVGLTLITGPGWATRRLDMRAGRFPLSVEGHLLRMTAGLVPGVTTVTTIARSYTLHTLVGIAAEERGLDWPSTLEVLRRAEVVAAAATLRHADPRNPTHPHGGDQISLALAAGEIDVEALSAPGNYTKRPDGFLGAYIGSEIELGLVSSTTLEVGPRADRDRIRSGFEGLLDAADRATVTVGDLDDLAHVSLDATAASPDGEHLAELFCGSGIDEPRPGDRTRQATIRMLVRSLELTGGIAPESAVRSSVVYGAALRTDPVLSGIEETEAWRGVLLRHQSVNAWRRFWAWLVDQIGAGLADVDGHTTPGQLADRAVDAVDADGTVSDWLSLLPAVTDAAGDPADAESTVNRQDRGDLETSLAIIALGARRVETLEGRTRLAFLGPKPAVLDPQWMAGRLDSSNGQPMRDFVNDLTFDVLDRARRVAQRKARMQRDGTYRLPSRVHEHGGALWKTSNEGRGTVGLRLNELARNLTAVGVLERNDDDATSVTRRGQQLLA